MILLYQTNWKKLLSYSPRNYREGLDRRNVTERYTERPAAIYNRKCYDHWQFGWDRAQTVAQERWKKKKCAHVFKQRWENGSAQREGSPLFACLASGIGQCALPSPFRSRARHSRARFTRGYTEPAHGFTKDERLSGEPPAANYDKLER